METIVSWVYAVGFSLPLLGISVVLFRSILSLTLAGSVPGSEPSPIKMKTLATTLVILLFTFFILLALLLIIFFIYKFAVPRYSFPLPLDIAGIIIFLLYIFGSGSLFFTITGRFGLGGRRNATLSGGLAEMVTEKMIGRASSRKRS